MTPAPPRVVFFGTPGAGKTTLIEGFLRAAGLGPDAALLTRADLRREVEPRQVLLDVGYGPQPLELCDSDGVATAELLAKPRMIGHARPTALPRAIRRADALVLAVDATAGADEVRELFAAFGRFLEAFQGRREHGREVGGLPVVLALTKCDALARPGDAPAHWLGRVERRVAEVRAEFVADLGAGGPYLPFGSIDLTTEATAIRLPDAPGFRPLADPSGAFGVAALARDVVTAAAGFRRRTLSAERRLRYTIGGLGGLSGVLLGALLALATLSLGSDPLLARVELLRQREGPPEVRLGERSWPGQLRELRAIRQHPRFDDLPDAARDFVGTRLAEVEAYRQYRAKFLPPTLPPAETRTADELRAVELALASELQPPGDYATAWAKTPASQLRAKWAADVQLLRTAEAALLDWYGGRIRRANALLLTESPPDVGWRREAGEVAADAPPPVPAGPLPGSPEVPMPGGEPLDGRAARESDRVVFARADWEATRDRLLALRNLCDILGVTRAPDGGPPPLELPEPTADAESLPLAGDRLRRLAAAYPGRPLKHPEWRSTEFSDPARRWLIPRLAAASDVAGRHVRRLLAARLPADTPDGWKALAERVAAEPPMGDWGALLTLLRRWEAGDDRAADPLVELLAFVRQDRFALKIAEVEIGWPDDLRGERLTPDGPLTIRAGTQTWTLPPKGDARRDRPLSFWTFASAPVTDELRAGEPWRAELPLRAGGQEYRLVWDAPRAATFAFDALTRPPVLERVGPIAVRERVGGVRAEVRPAGGWPRVPELLPDLQRE